MILLFLNLFSLTKKEYLHMAERIAKQENVPVNIFKAIIKQESSWNPYAIYGGRQGFQFASKSAALSKIYQLQKQGKRNINIGMMQVNIQHHKAPIEQLLDAEYNLKYGARYLKRLHRQFGSWRDAVGFFHAGNNRKYYNRYINKLCCVIPE